ncbi:MAG TPA: cation transporter [Anaerolineaceae bacterium]|nr:cation transporter [Anaerolineaceae bacterium]
MEDNCHVDPYQKEVRHEDLEKAEVVYLSVAGMGCPRCALRVQNGLNRLDGVYEAVVSLQLQTAEVYYDPQKVRLDDMVTAVSSAGDEQTHRYRAQVIHN